MSPDLANPFQLSQEALDACAREPIHIPGSIQPRGVLVVLARSDLTVTQITLNCVEIIGREPAQVLGQPITVLLAPESVAQIQQHLATAVPGAVAALEFPVGAGHTMLVLVHHDHDLVFLEALPQHADAPADAGHAPEVDLRTVHRQLTMLAVNQRLDATLNGFCQAVVAQVRALTGYDRVMIYRFDAAGNGEIFAEARTESIEPFLGLCYPAADIPPQARRLYLRNRVRVLGDIYAQAVPLLPRLNPVTDCDPDLSGCLLRSFSPIHLEYLHNMGVRATLTVSIIVEGQLWGLIACHHGAPHWPSYAMRVACDLLSEVISMQITLRSQHMATHATAQAQALQHDLIRRLAGHDDWFRTLAEPATGLHTLLDADGVAICRGEQVATIGITPDPMTILTLVTWLQETRSEKILITDALSYVNPVFAALASVASGMISLEISRTEGSYILWFRREVVQTITWGGNPAEKLSVHDGVARLHPRTSFAAWNTEMHGMARPWPLASIHLVEALRSVLVEVVLDLMTSRHLLVTLDLLRIRRAVEASSEAIAITNPDGVALFVNAAFCRLTGYDLQTVPAIGGIAGLPADPALAHTIEHASRSFTGAWQGELDLRVRDGTRLPVHLYLDTVHDTTGVRIGQIRLYTDLRARRRAEEERRRLDEQLFAAQKLESLGVLAGGIAHDFNNLLTAMLGHANLARLDLPDDSPAHESITQIELAAQRAAELSKQMLAYSGRGRFVIQPVNLNQVIIELARLLQAATTKTAVLRFQLAEHLPLITADITQIRQVVMNLITNASDAIGERSGVITLSTSLVITDREYLQAFLAFEVLPAGTYIAFEVSDTGVGMDVETQERIFEPFFTTKFTGRGLGLAAVQGIIRGHKGAIRVYSQLGRGTSIRVLFPVGAADEPAPPTTREAAVTGAGRLVLVIDDDPGVRAFAQRVLERGGYRVVTANDGREGVGHFAQQPDAFAAVLLDLTMPLMSGLETFAALRHLRSTVPVLLCSGYSEEEATASFAGKGLAGFVQKPFQVQAILAALHKVIA